MTIRLLLVFLLLIGAGTAVGQLALAPQSTDQVTDDQEESADKEPADEAERESPEMGDDVPSDELEPESPDEPETEAPGMAEEADAEPSQPDRDQPEPEMERAEPDVEQPMDEQDSDHAAILDAIESFVQAFNRGDAQSLAAHWTEHGDFVTAGGERWKGRQQIEERYAEYFAQVEDARLELEDAQIEFQSPSVAVETGIARVIAPGWMATESEYTAIHVRTYEGWKIDSVREVEVPQPPGRDELMQQLSWMVGQWVDQDEHADIKTTCRWATNRSFLVQTFRVFVADRVDFDGTQIIGWDPRAQTIRSWLFDSDGGFGAGRWSGSEGRWAVQTLQILPDGRIGSATNIYERIDDNTVTYRSVGRQVDGVILPDIDPVTIIRATEE